MSAMPQLRIADLLANAPVDPEAHLDAARVERYAETFDALPPVVVFDTAEGLLLVDGLPPCSGCATPWAGDCRSGGAPRLAAGGAVVRLNRGRHTARHLR
jgi:hypothetical protein